MYVLVSSYDYCIILNGKGSVGGSTYLNISELVPPVIHIFSEDLTLKGNYKGTTTSMNILKN